MEENPLQSIAALSLDWNPWTSQIAFSGLHSIFLPSVLSSVTERLHYYVEYSMCLARKCHGVFMVGSEMQRMRFSNELNFGLGLGFINMAELKMAETPPPLQCLWKCVC